MKKIISALAFGAILASTSYADLTRVAMGAGTWMQTPSGNATYNATAGANGTDTLKQDQKTDPYVWLLIKHPIPVIPNIRLEYSTVEATGNPTGQWGAISTSIIPISGTSSKLDLTQYDIIPYYSLLDNTLWMTLDVGLDLKMTDVDYKANATGSFIGYENKQSMVIPMVYLRARVQIPTTKIGIEGDVKAITNGTSKFYDVRAKIDYTFDFVPIIQPAVEVGYRRENINIDESSADIKTNITFSGFFAGVMLRF